MKKILLLSLLFTAVFSSCEKEPNVVGGKGGSAVLNVFPQHHENASKLINVMVYIRYNSLDAPSSGVYDDSVMCTNHDNLVSCTFSGLQNGDYYLLGKGFDTSVNVNVKGGVAYKITSQAAQDMQLAVSEY